MSTTVSPATASAATSRSHTLPLLLLGVVTVLLLAPFANKAFHIDDPLFLWTARQIQQHPLDFYGFNVNWYGTTAPMAEVMKNPPLAAYYLAGAVALLGWSEVALHLAFLLPALAVVCGTYLLAKRFCARPLWAALFVAVSPAFLLCASSVMCDTLMLAFWVWAIKFWWCALEANRTRDYALAALLVSLAVLTKYFGISLVPLLLAYSLAKHQPLRRWGPFLLLPLAVLLVYQLVTFRLYGTGLFSEAATYSSQIRGRDEAGAWSRWIIGLSFLGGCLLPALFCLPFVWSRRWGAFLLGLVALGLLPCVLTAHLGWFPLTAGGVLRWGVVVQLAVLVLAGLSVLGLSLRELWERREADALLLGLWCAGTFVFAAFVNWTINGRSLLPAVPAAAILLLRRIELAPAVSVQLRPGLIWWPLLPSAVLGWTASWADFRFAHIAREAAATAQAALAHEQRTLWFQGHWGFQYYMEQVGAKAIDFRHSTLSVGDSMVSPHAGTNLQHPGNTATQTHLLNYVAGRFLTTCDDTAGAGFHSDLFGPLPFALVSKQTEEYGIYRVIQACTFDTDRPPSRMAERYLARGLAGARKGDWKEAARQFQLTLELQPNSAAAHYHLGTLWLRQGNPALALEHWEQAVRLEPRWAAPLNNLAWILATHPQPELRNGPKALSLALRGAELTGTNDISLLDTLAAAYAETAHFPEAVFIASRAKALATANGHHNLAEQVDQRLQLYRSHQAFREPQRAH
jgi:4-amino-4-deoxy-L-arabinose transferase-like glycosyltransferase